mgnify:CR=1 FL=1
MKKYAKSGDKEKEEGNYCNCAGSSTVEIVEEVNRVTYAYDPEYGNRIV